MHFNRFALALGSVLAVVAACGGDGGASSPADAGTGSPTVVTKVDASAPPADGAPPAAVDAATPQDGGVVVIDKDAGAAVVRGSISRSAGVQSGLDGKGNLFIALMDKNPILDRANAKAVANLLVRDVDLAAAGSSIAYRMENVPVVHADLFVVTFFDDNGNADISGDGSKAGPDRGDLVNLDLTNPLKVKVDEATEYTVDVVLNAALPF